MTFPDRSTADEDGAGDKLHLVFNADPPPTGGEAGRIRVTAYLEENDQFPQSGVDNVVDKCMRPTCGTCGDEPDYFCPTCEGFKR